MTPPPKEKYLKTKAEPEKLDVFVRSTLPCIAQLVLDGEHLVPSRGLGLSLQQQSGVTKLPRKLAASIVALAFFCLFPQDMRSEYQLPDVNFDSFFENLTRGQSASPQRAKLQCFLHYFERLAKLDNIDIPGDIEFHRVVLTEEDELSQAQLLACTKPLCPLVVLPEGGTEGAGINVLQVNFANRYLGGGVLRRGNTQEEIRFSICPELMCALLFIECMAPNEAVVIKGFEQFSAYNGYAKSFQFAGDYQDLSEKDTEGNILTTLCSIDAVSYRTCKGNGQFEEQHYMRDLSKAYVGFLQPYITDRSQEGACPTGGDNSWVFSLDPHKVRAIATGNWGCGCFGGNAQFKALLQWIAASMAGCPALIYYTYNDPSVCQLEKVADLVYQAKWTVGQLMQFVVDVSQEILAQFTETGDWDIQPLVILKSKVEPKH